ncbi:mitochondrial distribution and morphology family 33, partial [Russula brevipes]
IRRWTERNSIAFRQHTDSLIARIAISFSRLGGEINRVTGYDEIETLKRQVVSQEARISGSRKAARDAKVTYEEAVQKRSDSQREVNSLLERKSTWTDTDVSRFTALVRQDHALEQEEARAKAAVAHTEDEVEREFSALMRTILARYHEEQVWSDKIRSVSTYGQLAVLGVNVLVFVLAIVLVEPWKRRRLTQAFEREVREMERANLDAVREGMGALRSRLEEQDVVLARLA